MSKVTGEARRAAGIANPEQLSIRILCMPRVAGYDFNPLSVYYCIDRGETLRAMIYKVNNTFGRRHTYVIPAGTATGGEAGEEAKGKGQKEKGKVLRMRLGWRKDLHLTQRLFALCPLPFALLPIGLPGVMMRRGTVRRRSQWRRRWLLSGKRSWAAG